MWGDPDCACDPEDELSEVAVMAEADEDAPVVDEEMPAGGVEEVLGVVVVVCEVWLSCVVTVEEIKDVVTVEEIGEGGSASSTV